MPILPEELDKLRTESDKAVNIDWTDEVLAKTCLTHGGEIKNERAAK